MGKTTINVNRDLIVSIKKLLTTAKGPRGRSAKIKIRDSAEQFVYNYFDLLSSEDYRLIKPIYANDIKRYYSAFNPDKEWVIEDILSYKTRFKVNSVQHLIDRSSIVSFASANGNYTIEFEMDYKLDRQEKWKTSNFHLKLFMEVNSQGKIVSIYEDILDKY